MDVIEVWAAIADVPYEVSTHGRVRRAGGLVLKLIKKSTGYMQVSFSVAGLRSDHLVHRIVARAFCAGYMNGLHVNHRDGDKTNNWASNLEWVTLAGNVSLAHRDGLMRHACGTASGTAKLNEDKVRKIRKRFSNGAAARVLAVQFGVHVSSIYRIVSRIDWKHVD